MSSRKSYSKYFVFFGFIKLTFASTHQDNLSLFIHLNVVKLEVASFRTEIFIWAYNLLTCNDKRNSIHNLSKSM